MNVKLWIVLFCFLSGFIFNCDLENEEPEEQPINLSHASFVNNDSLVIELNEKVYYETCTEYLTFYKVDGGERIELIKDPYMVDEAYYVDDTFYSSSYTGECNKVEKVEADSFTESLLFAEVTGQTEPPGDYRQSSGLDMVNVYSFTKVTGSLEFELIYYLEDTRPACTIQVYSEYLYTGSVEVE